MNRDQLFESYQREIAHLRSTDLWRELKDIERAGSGKIQWKGQEYLNLSSNDYLGLSSNESLHKEFLENIIQNFSTTHFGMASGSSRLLTGNLSPYTDLEIKLRDLYKSEAALVFNSGYHANIGILPALTQAGDLIISDELIHASMIDGIRLSRADKRKFSHLDYDELEEILKKERSSYDKVFIITESVYSMNGDSSDLVKLVELKNRYEAFLYLDEAHSIGVNGKHGLGLAEEKDLIDEIDLLIGTFGKALASQGAFLICNKTIQEFLINKMRSLIFTTALPPIIISWTKFILERVENLTEERLHLKNLSKKFKASLQDYFGPDTSTSHIIPLICGKNTETIQLAEALQAGGFLAFPIRTPTVPAGSARIRFSLTANMQWDDLSPIQKVIEEFYKKKGIPK